MTYLVKKPARTALGHHRTASRIALLALAAASLAACRPDHAGPEVAGWTLIEPSERHPILVSEQPVTMSVPVHRGSYGMSASSRERVAHFLHRFKVSDIGNSKLVISAPSGHANEVAGMQIVSEVRAMIADAGFAPSSIHIEPNRGASHVRISYLKVVARAPECGEWSTNLARDPANLPYPNFGCATQQNFAVMVANPSDLLGPRTLTPRGGDRRDTQWGKYLKGESTGAAKSNDEKISTQKSE